MLSKRFWLLLVFCLLFDDVGSKISRGGGGYGRGSSSSRGSSLGRSSSSGYGRGTGTSYGRTSGNNYGHGSGSYTGAANRGSNYGGNNYRPSSSGSSTGKGMLGGLIGGRAGSHGHSPSRGGGILGGLTGRKNHYGGGRGHGYSKGSGVGSMLRSNTFKNVIVGAAAGYLAYQGGKYLIRNAMGPMMWNNRPYYWGQNHYQPRPNTQMCRMPVDPNDQTLGNVYFQDQTRPREIVWGCGMGEHCCGYECCPSGMGMGGGMGGGAMPMGGAGMAPAIGAGAGMGAGMGRNYGDANEGSLSIRPSQAIGVRGMLRCNGMPAVGVLVKLYDHDTFTLDDLIAEGRSDGQGNFLISGHANEVTRITPKFNIYHDCNDFLPCQRKVSMYVPKHFVTQGQIAQNVYDAGVLELSGKFEGEERDCLHK